MSDEAPQLERTLGPLMLWGLGVGYVISGMYFGWNLGLPLAGPVGFLIATALATLLYVCFVLGYAELSCAIPRAGGAFDYAHRAFGPAVGFLTGLAQCVEFVIAPASISLAIGAYFALFLPSLPPIVTALGAYLLFTAINIRGVKMSAVIELTVTIAAVLELLVFAGVVGPHFSWTRFTADPMPNGVLGILAALPYAIWFYLGIEAVANVAEETRNPQKDLLRGFGAALITLVALAVLVLFPAVGIAGWKAVVYKAGTTETSDSPLPMALSHVVGDSGFLYHLLIGVGLFGLIASFHGIVLASGRATFEMGRAGFAPAFLGRVHPTRHTPAWALGVNMLIGIAAMLTRRTDDIIALSVFGALTLYAISMAALFALRSKEPGLVRPFSTPFYPVVPAVALTLTLVCLGSMARYNLRVFVIYLGVLAIGMAWYAVGVKKAEPAPAA